MIPFAAVPRILRFKLTDLAGLTLWPSMKNYISTATKKWIHMIINQIMSYILNFKCQISKYWPWKYWIRNVHKLSWTHEVTILTPCRFKVFLLYGHFFLTSPLLFFDLPPWSSQGSKKSWAHCRISSSLDQKHFQQDYISFCNARTASWDSHERYLSGEGTQSHQVL